MGYSVLRKRFYPSLRDQPERFWNKIDRRGARECWPWLGCTNNQGYGRAGKRGYAHRLAYELSYGDLPPRVVIRHACDNPLCCNPAHLLAGSQSENMRDAVARGRHYSPFSTKERKRHGAAPGGPFKREAAT